MWDVCLDLVLGSRCVVCGAPGRALCRACDAGLPRTGQVAWPTPAPPGLVLPVAAGAYDGALQLLVNAHKEQQVLALARPLGRVLAGAAADLARRAAPGRPLLLVPVPSRRSVVRRRGHDPVLRMTRRAAADLRGGGLHVGVAGLLRPARVVADQAGLGARDRAANLAGALRARPSAGRTDPGGRGAHVIVVDDVLTTGATAREAQRALEDAGWEVAGVAVVAATQRRPGPQCGGSLPDRDEGD